MVRHRGSKRAQIGSFISLFIATIAIVLILGIFIYASMILANHLGQPKYTGPRGLDYQPLVNELDEFSSVVSLKGVLQYRSEEFYRSNNEDLNLQELIYYWDPSDPASTDLVQKGVKKISDEFGIFSSSSYIYHISFSRPGEPTGVSVGYTSPNLGDPRIRIRFGFFELNYYAWK